MQHHCGIESAFHYMPPYPFSKCSLASLKAGPWHFTKIRLTGLSAVWEQNSATATHFTPLDNTSLPTTSLIVLQSKPQFMRSTLWEDCLKTKASWQESKLNPLKGQTKGYLSICSPYAPRTIAKTRGEMADGLQSYSNTLSLNHHMANNLSPHRAILPCSRVCTGESSPALLETQYFCKCITDKITFVSCC